MADNNALVRKFIARSRKRRNDLSETPGFKPAKQAKVPSYRPVKRSRKTSGY